LLPYILSFVTIELISPPFEVYLVVRSGAEKKHGIGGPSGFNVLWRGVYIHSSSVDPWGTSSIVVVIVVSRHDGISAGVWWW